ncbi:MULTISPECIES: hypothetical protein [unclassified Crossiella]|uniref:hypothetical protein n=1 Tax=unclassified Crossiella TaxID=2620835 RepID=UPI001FFEA4C5|nr:MULTISPECIES: hypothetical protein [unclassified Crossiella]MCK2244948.1 hypothetical protein [Crossiella sp. S99.2]MCK2258499.1 hypothetical protein [Crossiella sp. S99.1]
MPFVGRDQHSQFPVPPGSSGLPRWQLVPGAARSRRAWAVNGVVQTGGAVFFLGLWCFLMAQLNRANLEFFVVLLGQLPLYALGFGWTAAFLWQGRALFYGELVDVAALPGWRRTAVIGSLIILSCGVLITTISILLPWMLGRHGLPGLVWFQVFGVLPVCLFGDVPRSVVQSLDKRVREVARTGWARMP